jgi:hypothetical protein
VGKDGNEMRIGGVWENGKREWVRGVVVIMEWREGGLERRG